MSSEIPNPYSESVAERLPEPIPLGHTTTNALAIVSLIAGIVAFPANCVCVIGSFLGLGLSLAAIITGHLGLGQIRRQPYRYDGAPLAIAGLVLGYIAFFLDLLFTSFIVYSILTAPPPQTNVEFEFPSGEVSSPFETIPLLPDEATTRAIKHLR